MKVSLIIVGVILLAIGGVFYFMPVQTVSADTTTTGDGTPDTRTSTATFQIPEAVTIATLAAGLVLFILGAFIPSSSKDEGSSYVETKSETESAGRGGNKRKVTRHVQSRQSRN